MPFGVPYKCSVSIYVPRVIKAYSLDLLEAIWSEMNRQRSVCHPSGGATPSWPNSSSDSSKRDKHTASRLEEGLGKFPSLSTGEDLLRRLRKV
jgi:hypothetical protein